MENQLSPLEITVANIIENLELQPDALKPILAKLKNLRPIATQIESSIQQSQQSLKQLYENQSKVAGAFEALMDLIQELMPKETIEKHGKKLDQNAPQKEPVTPTVETSPAVLPAEEEPKV